MPEWDTLVADQEQQSVKASVDVAQVFAASYRKLVVQLYGIVGNASEAEDLVQEAFVRAYAAGPRFTRVDNPEAWLRTTAVNLYRNRWRKMRNFGRIKHRITAPPERGARRSSRRGRRPARATGEPGVVLVLHYFADRQVDEIAEELGIAEGTVKCGSPVAETPWPRC